MSAAPESTLSQTRPFYWSVRRELWENRSIFIGPAIAAGVVLFGFLISTNHMARRVNAALAMDPAQQAGELSLPYHIAAIAIIAATLIVAVVYCLGALHGERRDRSILFWKSLPVSDLTTVLSKASIPLLILPLVGFAIVVEVQLIMLVLSTLVLLMHGIGVGTLWTRLPLLRAPVAVFYGLATLTLWYAPIYGWLLLVSAWAKRTAFLWAVLPPLAVCVIEGIGFHTGHFASMLSRRLTGNFSVAFAHAGTTTDRLPQPDPLQFISSPGLWIGLAVAAAFLAGAVWLRRNREPV